jgi:5-methylcytosine-specific restriction endonuclease McrA
MKICEYKNCENKFEFRSNKRFCSRRCKENNREYVTQRKRPYRKMVGDKCSNCGFIPIHICQLDVDHIDGNKHNNNISNLQTLCSNCHRLKTYINKDWIKNKN